MQAIINKYGFKEGLCVKDGEIISWPYLEEKPTKSELSIIIEEYEASVSYMKFRREEYPLIEDQLDMIYHDKLDGTNIWYETICAIKNKYPK